MDFLRLYLGEMTSVVLVAFVLFVASAVATRYFPDRRMILSIIRDLSIAAAAAALAMSLIPSLLLNQPPRGPVDRTAVDQDQKAFERRYSNQAR